jgi:hypothetical protein
MKVWRFGGMKRAGSLGACPFFLGMIYDLCLKITTMTNTSHYDEKIAKMSFASVYSACAKPFPPISKFLKYF